MPSDTDINPELLESLRKITNPKHNPMCLGALSDEHLIKVYGLLSAGHSARQVAKQVVAWGVLPGVTQRGIGGALVKLAARLPSNAEVVKVQERKLDLHEAENRLKALNPTIDEIMELDRLILGLKAEFETWREEARTNGLPLKYVTDVGRLLLDCLDKSLELKGTYRKGQQKTALGVNIQNANILIQDNVEDPVQLGSFIDSFKLLLEQKAGQINQTGIFNGEGQELEGQLQPANHSDIDSSGASRKPGPTSETIPE